MTQFDQFIFLEWLVLNLILIAVALWLFYLHHKERNEVVVQERLLRPMRTNY